MAVAGNGAGDHPTNGATLRTVPAVPIAFAALGVLGLIDLLGGRDVVLSDLFTVGPCLAAVAGSWSDVCGPAPRGSGPRRLVVVPPDDDGVRMIDPSRCPTRCSGPRARCS